MMKRMMIFLCVFLILLVFFVDIQASDTRVKGLGYQANFYVRDSHNIWEFPSTLMQYRSMVIGESMFQEPADSGQLWSGGVHFPVTKTFVMGVYVRNSILDMTHSDTNFSFGIYPDRSGNEYYPNLNGTDASHIFTVFGGLQLGSADLALHLSSHNSRYSVEYTDATDNNKRKTYEDKLNYLTVGGGVSYKTNERTRFDGSLFYSMGHFSHIDPPNADPDTLIQREPESYYSYRVNVRMFYALNPKVVLVPFGQYGQDSRGYRSIDKTSSGNIKSLIAKNTYYMAGAALELIPRAKSLVALAAGFRGESWQSVETHFIGDNPLNPTTTLSTLPFVSIGLEGQIAKWLDARLSFYQLLNTHNIEQDNEINKVFDRTTITESAYAATFGLSFHIGRFDLDTLIDFNGAASFLHNGPALISGKDYSGEPLFSQISLIYRFQ